MYKVVYKTGKESLVEDDKIKKISDLASRRCLNRRQEAWLARVEEIIYVRESHNSLNEHRIHETKDLFESDCSACQKLADKEPW